MSALSNLDRNKLVHLIFLQNGQRVWFARTDRREDPITKRWTIIPIADTDARGSRPVTLEFALICQRRWRDELHLNVRIAFGPHEQFIDTDEPKPAPVWKHIDHFIHTDPEETEGFPVRAVCTPEGKMFCLRFDHPDLAEQSIFVPLEAGPAAAVQKAKEMHFLDVEKPKPSPFRAQREAAARDAVEQQEVEIHGRRRPGDCR